MDTRRTENQKQTQKGCTWCFVWVFIRKYLNRGHNFWTISAVTYVFPHGPSRYFMFKAVSFGTVTMTRTVVNTRDSTLIFICCW